jgi:RNA exonuclease 1
LILFVTADGRSPQWILVEVSCLLLMTGNIADEQNASQVAHTVVLFVPGLLPEHLGLPEISPINILPFSTAPSTYTTDESSPLPPCQVPAVSKMFSYGLPTRAPGDARRMFSALTTLTSSPMPDGMRAKRDQENKRIASMSTSHRRTELINSGSSDGWIPSLDVPP